MLTGFYFLQIHFVGNYVILSFLLVLKWSILIWVEISWNAKMLLSATEHAKRMESFFRKWVKRKECQKPMRWGSRHLCTKPNERVSGGRKMPWKLASLLARGRQLDNPPTQEPLQELCCTGWLFLKAVCSNRGGQTNYQGNEKDSEKKKKKKEGIWDRR